MSSESRNHGNSSNAGKKKRGLLLLTRMSWTQVDEDFSSPTAAVENLPVTPQLVDYKEENLCNWMDSGFYLSGSKDSEEGGVKEAACSPSIGMAQMTVQNYMWSLRQFSEMPVLSRWNSDSSSHSLLSPPKSITEWLDFCEKDPVEILLDLGFGTDEPDMCTKIPPRFISCASTAKGINIRIFLEAQRQRMDLENPNLCGRFRQLQVLDHATSVFSSLLSDVSAMQRKAEEGKSEEKSGANIPRGKAMISQAKRKKLGQLLRKASKQTLHGPQCYQNAGPSKVIEDCSVPVAGVDIHTTATTALSDSTILVSLKEELLLNEEVAGAMTVTQHVKSRGSKKLAMPHLPMKQPQFPSTFEMPNKDRSRKEPSLLLTHRLRRVSGLSKKPSDSFEMEEIQSFEDEYAWGNPPESTSDMIGTRTSSCQSDSSGFLEDPSDPAPLQGLSFPGNMRLSYNSLDCQAFLRHRRNPSLTSQDLLPNAAGPISSLSSAKVDHVPFLSSLSREHNFQGEDIFYSINEEDNQYDVCSGQSRSGDSERRHELDEKALQGRRGQLEKGDSYVEECIPWCHTDIMNQVDINSPYCGEEHQSVDSLIGHNGGEIDEDKKECEEIRDTHREVLEAIATDVIEKPHDLDSLTPFPDVTGNDEMGELNEIFCSMDTTRTSKNESNCMAAQTEFGVISRSTLQDSTHAPYCFGKTDSGSLDTLPGGREYEKNGCIPVSEVNVCSLKSVTVQMPSRLTTTMRSISLGETISKGQLADFTYSVNQSSKEECQFTLDPESSKGKDRQIREASVQTDRNQRNKGSPLLFPLLPSFHTHGHLEKTASLDTGLYWKHRSYYHEPLSAWHAQHRAHGCSFCSHHCGLMQPFTPSCSQPMTCCLSHATMELQLLKTLQLLQDTTMKNISYCTIHEIEIMKKSCQKFRERLDEIEQCLTEQEALFSGAMSNEGREERRRLQILRQAVRREVAELECQLQDRVRQVREGIIMHLNQLLDEQTCLCSELGISDRREERETKDGATLPDSPSAPLLAQAKCSNVTHHRWTPSKSEKVPSSLGSSLPREPELTASALATNQTSSTSDPEEFHTSKKESKPPSRAKIDFKSFIQNLKRSFRNSFSNDTAEGRD